MSNAIRMERFLWFNSQVKNDRYPNARHLSEKFEISRRTAKRLITFMRDRLGAPLEYNASRKGYAYSDASFELPKIPVSQEELLAILLANRLLSRTCGGFISSSIRHLGSKLMAEAEIFGLNQSHLPKAFSASWHGHSPVPAEVFQAVLNALLNTRLLDLSYCSPSSDSITRRIVEPHHLKYYMGSWVMIARCRLRDEFRLFYLSRMTSFTVLETHFDPVSFKDWKAGLDSAFGLFHSQTHTLAVLRFKAFRARWIREQVWHKDQQMKDLPDGGLRLTLPVADFQEIKMMILSFGADVVVESPDELKREVAAEIEAMGRIYGE